MSRGRLVLILGAISAFGPVSMDTYLPGLPALSRDLGVSASAAQLTLTACLVGLAGGQLVAGPLSDAFGRRRPLLVGLAAFTVASLLCAVAPDIWSLTAARLLQGAAGAAGIVIARAVARDLYSGPPLARFFSLLLVVNGLAPILAPVVGAQLLHVTDWRGVFVVLAGFGAVLFAAAGLGLHETLPPERRHGDGMRSTLRTFRHLLSERRFRGYVLSLGLVYAAMFAYIAGSPFVLQDIYGASAQGFSAIFGLNGAAILTLSAIGGRLVERVGPTRLLVVGLGQQAIGAVGLLAAVLADAGLAAVLVALLLVVSSIGLVVPNASALALADHPRTAGSASGLLGLCQFLFGAVAAPFVGVGGTDTALPMAIVVATCALAASAAYRLLVGRTAVVA